VLRSCPAESDEKPHEETTGTLSVMRIFPSVAASVVVVALIAAACGSTTTSPPVTVSQPGTTPGSSSQACATAPDTGTPAGWGTPTTPPAIVPLLVNSPNEMTCGTNRLLFLFLDEKTNAPIADPKRTAKVAFYDLGRDANKPTSTVDTTFVWAIENQRGNYIANVDFPEAGVWGAEITTTAGAATEKIRLTFSVAASSPVLRVGDRAPSTKTPTAADAAGIAKISTDTKPDPALYRTSADQALAKHEPFVIAFATPKFCQSAQCGPTLDRLKPFVAKYPGVDFIHVEPYQLELQDGQLQPVLTNNSLTPTDVVSRWGLLTEPWIFVVDRDGIIRASLELIFSDQELAAALDKVK
jgi:hypothetical protein